MIRRGGIHYVDWSPGRGSEQGGVRPALVVQNDVGNRFSSATIVAAVSTQRGTAYPYQVKITAKESGLPHDSIVKCEQLQTVDRSRLGEQVGALGQGRMADVEAALHRSLGFAR